MGLVVVSLVLALGLGKLAGGSLTRLAGMPLRGWPLLAAALAVEATGSVTSGRWYAGGLACSAALVLAFLARNRTVPGVALVGLGLLLNAAVVAANGAMPVSRTAADSAGVDVAAVAAGADPRHEISDAATRLPILGDVLPMPLPGRPEIVSPGDVVVVAGLALLVVTGMRRAPVRYRPDLMSPPRGAVSGGGRPARGPAGRRHETMVARRGEREARGWRSAPASARPGPRTRPTTARSPTPERKRGSAS